MTTRELLSLALRITGFWSLISAIPYTAQIAAIAASPQAASRFTVIYVSAYALSYSIAAASLLLLAPTISSWFYPGSELPKILPEPLRFSPRDLYEISARVLGIFSLLIAIGPACGVSAAIVSGELGHDTSSETSEIAPTIAYLVAGLCLVFLAPSIAELFTRSQRGDNAA